MSAPLSRIELLVFVFCFSFFFFYPTFFFSVDELSYVTRALAFSEGMNSWTQITVLENEFSWAPADYPLGTAFLLAPFAWFFGKGIFLSGMVYILIGIYFIYKTLQKLDKVSILPFVIFFIFPPTIYFSRGVMSEMPSLTLISFFLYGYVSWKSGWKKFLALGTLAGLSILLRETNILVCGGLVLLPCFRNIKYFTGFSIGVALGVVPRLLTGNYFYGNGIYVKKAASFDWFAISHNFTLYLIISLVLLPGGLYVLYKLKGIFARSIQLSLGLFIVLHLFYTYHSGDHSGSLVSVFYNGRYFIPTLPLWCVAYAGFAKQNNFFNTNRFNKITIGVCLLFIISFHGFLNYLGDKHEEVAMDIFENYNDEIIIYHNAAYRYLNPLHGTINQLMLVDETSQLSEKAYYVLSHRNKTKAQEKELNSHLNQIEHTKELIKTYQIFDGTEVLVFSITHNE